MISQTLDLDKGITSEVFKEKEADLEPQDDDGGD